MAQKPCGMHPEEIKSQLRQRYGTLQAVSEQLGLSRNAISNTISRPGYSVRNEGIIARLLEKTVIEVWGGERYHANGTPVSQVADRTPTSRVPADLRRNGVAA
ncbi:helix-turn-helix domain-containing protein [Gluconobacter oxydans]|uniref:helix-turn-helix domain-containing protein n=1 Tax=Gluconobacter oxydans TaxID=442 RepID=UPI003463C697